MILAVSLLAVDYAKSRKELIEKKEIENASYYIYKTNKTKDKKILSYTIRSEINTKTKLKRKNEIKLSYVDNRPTIIVSKTTVYRTSRLPPFPFISKISLILIN